MAPRKPLQALDASSENILQNKKAVNPPRGPKSTTRYGPKPKALAARVFKLRGPVIRVKRSYSKSKKIEVLMFLTHHRVYCATKEEYRAPIQMEAAIYFKIPQRTISVWWQNQEGVLSLRGGRYRDDNTIWKCAWPKMEGQLFDEFCSSRQEGQLVRRSWFRRKSREIFVRLYTQEACNIFVFSTGWFLGFLRRWNISCRVLTKKASRLPEEYHKLVLSWLRFNRRNSTPIHTFDRLQITADVGRYWLSNILNINETPIPFEYLDGRTYDIKGSKTISGKSSRSGWDKRQATLILYLFADGYSYIKPKIIFAGTAGSKGSIKRTEGHLYHPRVTVEFNPTAYNNEELFLQFLHHELLPVLGAGPSLLLLDAAAFHTTPAVLTLLKENHVVPSLIPGGCTGLLQPLDTAVNKPFKEYLREYTDIYMEKVGKKTWSVGDRRVMTTHVVGEAWAQFCVDKKSLIQKSFRDVGVTLPIDGSRDLELSIKGFNAKDLTIGMDEESPATLPEFQSMPLEPIEALDSIVFSLRDDFSDLCT